MSAWSGRLSRNEKPGARNLGPVSDFTQSCRAGFAGLSYDLHTVWFLQSGHVHRFAAAPEPQPGATRRRGLAHRQCAHPRGRRLWQDPCAHHPHRLAAPDRAGVARRHPGRDLHQQGRQGNDDAAHRHAAGQRARHVDRHLPRPVQPVPARALQAAALPSDLPDPGHAGPALGHQAADEAAQRRRRAFSGQADAVVHRRRQGRRPAPERLSRSRSEDDRKKVELYQLYEEQCQREGVVDFGELMLRSYELLARQRAGARALPAALSATSWSTSSRTPTACSTPGSSMLSGNTVDGQFVPGDNSVLAVGDDDQSIYAFRGAQRRQHGRLRARVRCVAPDQAGAELPQLQQHPRLGQPPHQPQHEAPGQEPAHRPGPGRAGAGVRVDQRFRRGAVDGRRDPPAGARRLRPQGNRGALPQQCAEPGDRNRALQCRRALPRVRRPALLRACRNQACAGLPAPAGEPGRRHQLPAHRQFPAARHRRAHHRAAAGRARAYDNGKGRSLHDAVHAVQGQGRRQPGGLRREDRRAARADAGTFRPCARSSSSCSTTAA